MSDEDAINGHGDLFVIRVCDECGGAVIERTLCKPHGDKGPREPDVSFCMEPSLLPWAIQRLKEIAGKDLDPDR